MLAAKIMAGSLSDFVRVEFELDHLSAGHVHPSFFGFEPSVARPDVKWVYAQAEQPFNFVFEHFDLTSDHSIEAQSIKAWDPRVRFQGPTHQKHIRGLCLCALLPQTVPALQYPGQILEAPGTV